MAYFKLLVQDQSRVGMLNTHSLSRFLFPSRYPSEQLAHHSKGLLDPLQLVALGSKPWPSGTSVGNEYTIWAWIFHQRELGPSPRLDRALAQFSRY